MSRVLRSLVAVVVLALAVPAAAQPDPAKVEVKVVAVAEGVWMLQGAGGNIGLSAGEDGAFLVDDDYAPLTAKVRAAVASVTAQPVRFVLNTHWHGDHTGGNENFGEAGAVIVAHDNVRRRMSTEQVIAAMGRTVPPSPDAALPVVTFADCVTFHVNGDTLSVFHLPAAHTDGDAAVYWQRADVLHTGDLYFASGYPFIDRSSGGSLDGLVAAVERLLERAGEGTRVIPGHGGLSDRAGLTAYLEMLRGVRARVAALIAEGKTRDETIAAKPTTPWDERWAGGFIDGDTFTGFAYDSLTAAR
ncbi:MAG TPA: MBL fold metallo-hydrolase [Thermoanaerobaculia bacterium]|nr:MBL fold metallo-hydrolase [Thermoanaerobaculia bacterium]